MLQSYRVVRDRPSQKTPLRGKPARTIAKQARGGTWTHTEDELLSNAVAQQGAKKWRLVAEVVPGRSGKQCRERWTNYLSPLINWSKWTEEEDELLLKLYALVGSKWAAIAGHFSGRTDNSVKNRFNVLSKRPEELQKMDQSVKDAFADRLGEAEVYSDLSPSLEFHTPEQPRRKVALPATEDASDRCISFDLHDHLHDLLGEEGFPFSSLDQELRQAVGDNDAALDFPDGDALALLESGPLTQEISESARKIRIRCGNSCIVVDDNGEDKRVGGVYVSYPCQVSRPDTTRTFCSTLWDDSLSFGSKRINWVFA